MAFDKVEIRKVLTLDDIYQLLIEWGGEPEYTDFGIISSTICHNVPGEGSRKLYYYSNSTLFKCYTECDDSFDIFELTMKVMRIQNNKIFDLNDAVRYIAYHFGILNFDYKEENTTSLEDWSFLEKYDRIEEIIKDASFKDKIILKEYDDIILSRLNYSVKILPWLKDNISQQVMEQARIGFFPGPDQITIPHFDEDNRFIGLRGRALCKTEAERFGKYRPVVINQIQYSHPRGMNLYGLKWSKQNIKTLKKALVVESEKSVLQYASYFGFENNISVACCGSNISTYQIEMLMRAGANEVIIGFDRQFQEIGDNEFQHLTQHLQKIYNKYKNYVNISFIFDKEMITGYKSSPTDEGKEKFLKLFNERVYLK
jgi:hypothetical protein